MTVKTFTVGMELPQLRIEPITRKTLALFAGASGDHQPTHIDIDAAKAKGRDDVIAHGMLTMAYLGRLLTGIVAHEKVRVFKARFVAMVPPHAQLTCGGRVVSIENGLATLELVVSLEDGEVAVRGDAVIDIQPSPPAGLAASTHALDANSYVDPIELGQI